MDQLQNWATLLHDHIDKLTLSAEETKRLQNESEYIIKEFGKSEESNSGRIDYTP